MTYDDWRETYFSGPLMNEAMARAAWNAAIAQEREACPKLCETEFCGDDVAYYVATAIRARSSHD